MSWSSDPLTRICPSWEKERVFTQPVECVGEREGRGEIRFSWKMINGLVRNYCVNTLKGVT
jgi:hypothetical protein